MRGGGGGGDDDDDDEIKGTCVLHLAYVCITLLIGIERRASRVTGRREPAGGPTKFPLLNPRIPGSRPLHFGLPPLAFRVPASFSLSSSFFALFRLPNILKALFHYCVFPPFSFASRLFRTPIFHYFLCRLPYPSHRLFSPCLYHPVHYPLPLAVITGFFASLSHLPSSFLQFLPGSLFLRQYNLVRITLTNSSKEKVRSWQSRAE